MTILDIRKVIQELVVPELQELKTSVKILDTRLDSLEREIDARFDAVDSRLHAVEQRLDSVDQRLASTIGLHKRVARLEALIARN